MDKNNSTRFPMELAIGATVGAFAILAIMVKFFGDQAFKYLMIFGVIFILGDKIYSLTHN